MLSIDQPSTSSQRLDPMFGIVMPWYTHGALDEIAKWDARESTVLEWGGGCSTFWWSRVAKRVHCIEAHKEWADWITATARERGFDNITVEHRFPHTPEEYTAIPAGLRPDIVCVDGSERSACILAALELPRPIRLIVDNWQQDYVFIDQEIEQRMAKYGGSVYTQADHTDHEGRPWKTGIWHLGEEPK